MDASTQTVDPDRTSETLICNWSCEVQGGGSCDSAVAALISGCQTEVPSTHFFAGTTYMIRFNLKKKCNRFILLAVDLFNSKSGRDYEERRFRPQAAEKNSFRPCGPFLNSC